MKWKEYYLNAKHWQIFALLFGLPFVFCVIAFVSAIFSIAFRVRPDTGVINTIFRIFPLLLIINTVLFFGWFYSIATVFHKKLPLGVRMNLGLYKLFVFIPVAYIFLVSVFLISIFGEGMRLYYPFVFVAIVPLHLFSVFCILYNLYFFAKVIKSIELQREALVGDYIIEFILLWFYPVGIWILQPRINILANQNS